MTALLDTTVFIARESGRAANFGAIPTETHVCVITMAELQAGVLAADDVETRAQRLATVELLASTELLPVDDAAARSWAVLRVRLRDARRAMKVNDLWIAAIAHARGLAVVTQDTDFDVLAELGLLKVIRL